MKFVTHAAISLLAGIGAGFVGFWTVWRLMIGTAWDSIPGPGYSKWLLGGIFVPGVLGALIVFHAIGKATRRTGGIL